jgi:hypothetical protein
MHPSAGRPEIQKFIPDFIPQPGLESSTSKPPAKEKPTNKCGIISRPTIDLPPLAGWFI